MDRAWVVGFGAAVAVLAGCSGATGPNINGIEVTLSLSREEIPLGDTFEVHVLATNVTARELSFLTDSCVLVVQILDQSNRPFGQRPNTCNSIGITTTLGSGESLERIVVFDTAPPPKGYPEGTFTNLPLGSGTYRVFAGISSDLLNPSDTVELRIPP